MPNKDIIQELSDLGSNLGGDTLGNVYSVPARYFEGFSQQVLALIQTSESLTWISSLPRETPFHVPPGYFDGLDERIIEFIRRHPDHQSSSEELTSVSPLLSTISKRPVYSVPKGYFENFKPGVEVKATKVVSMTGKKWLRFAAAATVVGVILTVGFIAFNNNNKSSAGNSLAKLEKDVKKINDVKSTENLIDFMDAGLNEKELASSSQKSIKTDDVQQLLKDVPIDELKDFNEESKAIEDVMMTN